MGKKIVKASGEVHQSFSGHRSYSVAQIMAAGGTTAFANKMGKNPKVLEDRLKELPKNAYLTDDEVKMALRILEENK